MNIELKKRQIKIPGLEVVQGSEENSRIIKNLPVTNGVCLVKLDQEDQEDKEDQSYYTFSCIKLNVNLIIYNISSNQN